MLDEIVLLVMDDYRTLSTSLHKLGRSIFEADHHSTADQSYATLWNDPCDTAGVKVLP